MLRRTSLTTYNGVFGRRALPVLIHNASRANSTTTSPTENSVPSAPAAAAPRKRSIPLASDFGDLKIPVSPRGNAKLGRSEGRGVRRQAIGLSSLGDDEFDGMASSPLSSRLAKRQQTAPPSEATLPIMPATTTASAVLREVTRGALDLRISRDHANAQSKAVQSEARSPPATAPDQTPEQRAEPQALKIQRNLPPLGQTQVPARLRAPRTKAPDSVQRANWDGLMKPRVGDKTANGDQTRKQRSSLSMSPPRNRSSGPARAKGAVGRQYKPGAGKGVAVVVEGGSQRGWGGGEGLKEVASPVVMGPKDLESLFSPQPSLVRQLIPQDQVIPPELHAELVFERIAGDYSRFFPADARVVGGKHVGSCNPLSIAGFTLARRRDIDLEQRKRMLGIVRKVLDTGSTQVFTVHA